jgi:hypothetical protein
MVIRRRFVIKKLVENSVGNGPVFSALFGLRSRFVRQASPGGTITLSVPLSGKR